MAFLELYSLKIKKFRKGGSEFWIYKKNQWECSLISARYSILDIFSHLYSAPTRLAVLRNEKNNFQIPQSQGFFYFNRRFECVSISNIKLFLIISEEKNIHKSHNHISCSNLTYLNVFKNFSRKKKQFLNPTNTRVIIIFINPTITRVFYLNRKFEWVGISKVKLFF